MSLPASAAGTLGRAVRRSGRRLPLIAPSLAQVVGGRVVMVTGASSGIGRATAVKMGAAGGVVLLVARRGERLAEAAAEIERLGGSGHAYPCDLTDEAAIQGLCERALAEHGAVDVLINNAGRSIRRSIDLSYDRMHDYRRTMELNYFAAVKLTLGLLPAMREQHRGHIVNVSSLGVQTNTPRYSAYVASKAALDAFARCAAVEVIDDGVHFSTVYMPLVRTAMSAPTDHYRHFPARSPDQAADLICKAIVGRQKSISTNFGRLAEVTYATIPGFQDAVVSTGYRLFPDSAAARGDEPASDAERQLTAEQRAFERATRGVHW
jgi:NAD(P)-dependent dehydrogenase (short-subunit alcohol dehydrogenase family)